jgi:hypothetical protein
MTIEELQHKITDLDNLINRDASYSVPSNRITAEQTLALWQVALELAKIRESLSDLPAPVTSFQSFKGSKE